MCYRLVLVLWLRYLANEILGSRIGLAFCWLGYKTFNVPNPIRSTFNYKPSERQDTEQQNNNARVSFRDDSYAKKEIGSKKPYWWRQKWATQFAVNAIRQGKTFLALNLAVFPLTAIGLYNNWWSSRNHVNPWLILLLRICS